MTKSSIDVANTIMKLAKIAGPSSGSSTVRSACVRRRAEVLRGFLVVAPDREEPTADDHDDVRQRERDVAEDLRGPSQRHEREDGRRTRGRACCPCTISGVASGTSISPFERARCRPRQRVRPSASATPSGVAISIVTSARVEAVGERLTQRRVVQHRPRRVAPVPAEREPLPGAAGPAVVERELDRDRARARCDHAMYAHVTVARTHGLAPRVANHARDFTARHLIAPPASLRGRS